MLEAHVDAEPGEGRRQQRGGRAVELALHEPVDEVDDADRARELREGVGRLEAEQAAADDRRVARAPRPLDHARAVDRIAEDLHARRPDAGERRHEGVRARAEHGAVEVQDRALGVGERRGARVGVERHDPGARAQCEAVVLIPGVGPQPQSLERRARLEQRAEADAVVGLVRLAADERDRDVRVAGADGLADRLARDAAADDQDPGGREHQTPAVASVGMREPSGARRRYTAQVSAARTT